jgi:hypothetical protein
LRLLLQIFNAIDGGEEATTAKQCLAVPAIVCLSKRCRVDYHNRQSFLVIKFGSKKKSGFRIIMKTAVNLSNLERTPALSSAFLKQEWLLSGISEIRNVKGAAERADGDKFSVLLYCHGGKGGDFRGVGVLRGVVRRGIKLEEKRCACLCGKV